MTVEQRVSKEAAAHARSETVRKLRETAVRYEAALRKIAEYPCPGKRPTEPCLSPCCPYCIATLAVMYPETP